MPALHHHPSLKLAGTYRKAVTRMKSRLSTKEHLHYECNYKVHHRLVNYREHDCNRMDSRIHIY